MASGRQNIFDLMNNNIDPYVNEGSDLDNEDDYNDDSDGDPSFRAGFEYIRGH